MPPSRRDWSFPGSAAGSSLSLLSLVWLWLAPGLRAGGGGVVFSSASSPAPRRSLAPTPCSGGPRCPWLGAVLRGGRGVAAELPPHPVPRCRSGTDGYPGVLGACFLQGSACGWGAAWGEGCPVSGGRGRTGSRTSLPPAPAQPGGGRVTSEGPLPRETGGGPRRLWPRLPTLLPAGGERWKGVHLGDQPVSQPTGFPSKRRPQWAWGGSRGRSAGAGQRSPCGGACVCGSLALRPGRRGRCTWTGGPVARLR